MLLLKELGNIFDLDKMSVEMHLFWEENGEQYEIICYSNEFKSFLAQTTLLDYEVNKIVPSQVGVNLDVDIYLVKIYRGEDSE